jgi:hypothetical protein
LMGGPVSQWGLLAFLLVQGVRRHSEARWPDAAFPLRASAARLMWGANGHTRSAESHWQRRPLVPRSNQLLDTISEKESRGV